MEKKNTVLLTVIAVATLLVAVVGATFAYFTATTTPEGAGTANTSTTTQIGSVKFELATTANTADIKYPGGMMVNGASVTATVEGTGTFAATYKINATVDASALASENTTVEYALYRTTSPVATTMSGCKLQTEVANGITKYYYTGCTAAEAITKGTTKVAGDTITISSGTKTATISELDNVSFTGDNKITKAAPKTVYYYLVVEYVNNTGADVDQNADMGKSISATITSVSDVQATADAA